MPSSIGSLEIIGASLFALAVLHTFSTRYFEHLAHTRTAHAGVWHLLGEVEAVFGFWAFVLVLFMALAYGWGTSSTYLDSLQFTEPMFVFVIMVIAASRPVMQLAGDAVEVVGRLAPVRPEIAGYFLALSMVPLLGSFITEPAAMTLAALMLRERIFSAGVSSRLKYATLGVLFVNVSVGGTLTHFAAPPVLMVAAKWGWTSSFMLSTFGVKSILAVLINSLVVTLLFRRELATRALGRAADARSRVPAALVLVNVLILAAVVFTNHHPEAFMGLFLLFLGLAEAYRRVLSRMDETALFYGATALTAITDNAALTYLGSLVEGVSEDYKYSLVAGAVAGGGLTVIANAPNPAGFAILKDHFEDYSISALGLFAAALVPTLVVVACFRGIRGQVGEIFDPVLWGEWFAQLDRSFLFLLILPFVVAAVGLWAELRRKGDRQD
jgi:hypothetical protein